ncbi:hypothetical protein IJG04_00455 [Candidatus Saccharibacteria bacterium]|nr:hypothetical protein [Candidatus Saccharibacteria bacterium]
MITYKLNGAWGNEVPDEKLTKVLSDLGIKLEVEARTDGLSNVQIAIDDKKVMKGKKRATKKTVATKVSDVNN